MASNNTMSIVVFRLLHTHYVHCDLILNGDVIPHNYAQTVKVVLFKQKIKFL